MNTIEEIAGVLTRVKSAVIFTHTRPDGDAIGSALALSRAFFIKNIKNEVVVDGDIPEKFSYLQGIKDIRQEPSFEAECFVCVDSSDLARLGELQKCFLAGVKRKVTTVNIDHHISNTKFCKYNYVQNISSNCENIARVITAMGVKCEGEIATCLMTGLVTDSGAFSHSDVNGDTFRTAAMLVDGGADVNQITYDTFRKQSKARAQMYLEVLGRLRYWHDDKLVVAVITQDTLKKYDLKPDATEGIVDFGLTIDSVEVSVCIMQVKKHQYKASFRSKGKVNVNEVAGVFGGGGHILASGCMFFGDIEEILDKLSYTVYQRLEG